MGGLSTVKPFTTDANNMGGLFVRKVGGAAMLAVHLHKLYPLLFHPSGAEWKLGHFRPLLATAVFSNAALLVFYSLYLEDFTLAGADDLPKVIMGLLGFETVVMTGFMLWQRTKQSATQQRAPAVAMRDGKTPNSVPSRILCRTVALVSTLIALVAGRDLFFPGEIIPFFPRDDIYLEWTNAFLHSPPTGTPEAAEQGLEAPLYIGDKFSSQLMAVHILLLCLYKFVSTCIVRVGSDGAGYIQTKMMWAVSALGGAMVVGLFRLFTPAAQSASLDMRWHLMCMAYETFLFGTLSWNEETEPFCVFVAFIVLFVAHTRLLLHLPMFPFPPFALLSRSIPPAIRLCFEQVFWLSGKQGNAGKQWNSKTGISDSTGTETTAVMEYRSSPIDTDHMKN